MYRNLLVLIFCIAYINVYTQCAYDRISTIIGGKEFYRYNDGYTISKEDFEKSDDLTSESDSEFQHFDPKSALSLADNAIRLNKKNQDAWYYRGRMYLEFDKYEEAYFDFSESLRLCRRSEASYWALRSRAYLNFSFKRDFDAAILDYTDLIDSGWHGEEDAYVGRGAVKEAKGNFESARDDYKKALEINPNFEVAKTNLLRIQKKIPISRTNHPATVHLVTVGISNYQQDFEFNHLEFTVSGAYLIRNLFERRNLTNHSNPLIESGACRSDILSALKSLTDSSIVMEEDMVIFYFSGHGLLTGGKVGICPYNYQNPGDLISDDEIAAILNHSPARHKVCLIEACKSEKSADYIDPSTVAEFNRRRQYLSPGIVFITSTEVGKKSWGGTEGYFTKAIIEALSEGKADTDGDHVVTAAELFNYIQPAVKAKTNNQQVPQINAGYPKDLPLMLLDK